MGAGKAKVCEIRGVVMVLTPRESAFVRRILRRAPISGDVTSRVMTSSRPSGEITLYWNDQRLIYIGDMRLPNASHRLVVVNFWGINLILVGKKT